MPGNFRIFLGSILLVACNRGVPPAPADAKATATSPSVVASPNETLDRRAQVPLVPMMANYRRPMTLEFRTSPTGHRELHLREHYDLCSSLRRFSDERFCSACNVVASATNGRDSQSPRDDRCACSAQHDCNNKHDSPGQD
ncbi:MAG: hypothetical protein ABI548_23240 [Polyangiaceae bacterium]